MPEEELKHLPDSFISKISTYFKETYDESCCKSHSLIILKQQNSILLAMRTGKLGRVDCYNPLTKYTLLEIHNTSIL